MQNPTSEFKSPVFATIVLWSARVLTFLILCFWLFFLTAHLLGSAGASSRPLTLSDYVSLAAMLASLLGLGLALKWYRLGATISLVAVAVGALVNWRVLLFPATLIPITAALFLLYSILQISPRRQNAAAVH